MRGQHWEEEQERRTGALVRLRSEDTRMRPFHLHPLKNKTQPRSGANMSEEQRKSSIITSRGEAWLRERHELFDPGDLLPGMKTRKTHGLWQE